MRLCVNGFGVSYEKMERFIDDMKHETWAEIITGFGGVDGPFSSMERKFQWCMEYLPGTPATEHFPKAQKSPEQMRRQCDKIVDDLKILHDGFGGELWEDKLLCYKDGKELRKPLSAKPVIDRQNELFSKNTLVPWIIKDQPIFILRYPSCADLPCGMHNKLWCKKSHPHPPNLPPHREWDT